MKVQALQLGFYGGARRRPGVVFEVKDADHLSYRWMKGLCEESIAGIKAKREADEAAAEFAAKARAEKAGQLFVPKPKPVAVAKEEAPVVAEDKPARKRGRSSGDAEVI